MRIKVLRNKKAALLTEAGDLNAKIDAGSATENVVERARVDAITKEGGELDQINAQIKTEERLMDERRAMTPVAGTENDDTETERRARIEVPKNTEKFTSLGEELQAIANAGRRGISMSEWDRRLVPLYVPGGIQGTASAPSGASEQVPSDGGFLVQRDMAAPMLDVMFEAGALLSRVRHMSISSNANGVIIPAIDESSRANGSRWGGIQVYWADEADTVNATKPKFRNIDMRLKKLMGIAYSTDELLADASMLEGIFQAGFIQEMTFKAEDGIINGTGAGQMLGILNSGAVVSVAADSSQVAGTITTTNILGMFNRLPPRSMTKAVWLVNQQALPQIQQLTLGSGTAVVRLYHIPGDTGQNNASAGAGFLLGRPVIPCEYCAALGTPGDIILVDLDQYLIIDKGGINSQSSMHVRFLYDEMTFRWTYRIDGQPLQRTAVTPYKGSATISPYLTLAAR